MGDLIPIGGSQRGRPLQKSQLHHYCRYRLFTQSGVCSVRVTAGWNTNFGREIGLMSMQRDKAEQSDPKKKLHALKKECLYINSVPDEGETLRRSLGSWGPSHESSFSACTRRDCKVRRVFLFFQRLHFFRLLTPQINKTPLPPSFDFSSRVYWQARAKSTCLDWGSSPLDNSHGEGFEQGIKFSPHICIHMKLPVFLAYCLHPILAVVKPVTLTLVVTRKG